MIYDEYEDKIEKRLSRIRSIMRFRLLILLGIILIIAFVTTMLSVNGMVYDESCPTSVTYGTPVAPNASAVFKSVTYQYRLVGSEEWHDGTPQRVGDYEIRAVSKGSFGTTRGQILQCTILPLKADIKILNKELVYGDDPDYQAELGYDDKITINRFDFGFEDDIVISVAKDNIIVENSLGEDVTECYDLTLDATSLTILRRPVKITVADKSKIYDGEELSSDDYSMIGSIAKRDELNISFDDAITDVGEVVNLPTYTITGDGDVSKFYDIEVVPGKLTVLKRPLTVTTESAQIVYDGKEHSYPIDVDDYIFDSEKQNTLADGQRMSVSAAPTVKDVGTTQNSIQVAILDKTYNDVTHNYDIKYSLGSIEVTARPINIVMQSVRLIYDGKEHSYPIDASLYEGEKDLNLAEGHTIVTTSSVLKVIDASDTPYLNSAEVEIHDENGEDVTKNYACTVADGYIEISRRPINIVTESDEFVYDGTEHNYPFNKELYAYSENRDENLADGHTFAVLEQINTFIDARDEAYENSIKVDILDNNDKVVTNNYTVSYSYGAVKINFRPIKIVTSPETFVYDGKEHSFTLDIDPYTYSEEKRDENLANGHKIGEIKYFNGNEEGNVCKEVGSSLNFADVLIFDSQNKNVTENYSVSYSIGVITVKPRPINLTTEQGSWVYDGKEHKKELDSDIYAYVEGSNQNLADGHEIIVLSDSSIKTVGSKDNEVSVKITDSADVDVTENYEITHNWGVLTVTHRPLNITTESISVTYDGQYHNKTIDVNSYSYVAEGENKLAENQTMRLTHFTNVIDAAKEPYENVNTVNIFDKVEDVTDNYNFTYSYGTITINYRDLNITTGTKTWTYDGQEHDYLYIDKFYNYFNNNRFYDTESQLVENQYLLITNYTSIINAGSLTNNIVVTVNSSYYGDVTKNYKITYNYGNLTVNKRPVTFKTCSKTWVYDGEEHSYPILEEESKGDESGLVNGQSYKVNSSTTIKDITDSDTKAQYQDNVITKDAILIMNGNADVTDNYEIIVDSTYGKLRIKTRTIVAISAKSKEYDGQSLTFNASDAVKVLVHAPDETVTITGTQSITTVDVITLTDLFGKWNGGTDNGKLTVNVKVTQTNMSVPEDEIKFTFIGSPNVLEITKRKITITSKSASKKKGEFTGNLSDNGYDITYGTLANGDKIESISVTGTLSHSQTSAENTVSNAVIKDKNGKDVTQYYEITYVPGTLSWIEEG